MAQKKRLILYLALTWLRKIESWYFWRVTLEILKVRYEHVNFCSRSEKNVEVPFLHLGGTGKRFNKNKLFSEEFWLHKITVILSESQQFCNISLKSCNGVSSASTGVTKIWRLLCQAKPLSVLLVFMCLVMVSLKKWGESKLASPQCLPCKWGIRTTLYFWLSSPHVRLSSTSFCPPYLLSEPVCKVSWS